MVVADFGTQREETSAVACQQHSPVLDRVAQDLPVGQGVQTGRVRSQYVVAGLPEEPNEGLRLGVLVNEQAQGPLRRM